MTLGPSTFHVQLYKGSQHRRSVSLLAFLVLAVSAFGQSPQIVLGSSQIQSSQDTNPSGMAEAFPVTAPSTAQVSSLYVFLDRSNTAATAWVGLYTSWYRHPRTLLTQSIISKPLPGQWNAVAVPPVQVTQGTRYWIALLGLNGEIQFRDSTSNCHSETSQQTNLASLPGTWSTGSRFDTCLVSMFAAGALAPAHSAANDYFADSFSVNHFATARSTSAIHSHSEWNEQFGCQLGSIGRHNQQHRYVQGAVCRGNLHRNCDQRSRPHQIKLSNCHGCDPIPGFHFDFANDQQPPNGWTASVRRHDLWN